MAQGRLIGAAAAVVALGAAAEVLAPAPTGFETALDFTVGAVLACGGAWLLGRAPAAGALGLLAGVAWYLGTLSGASSDALASIGSACVLAYRGPLLQLIASVPSGRLPRSRIAPVLAAAAWVAALLPAAVGGPATAAIAAIVAAVAIVRARRSAAGRRQALLAAAVAAAALSAVWWLAVFDLAGRTALLVLNDVAVLAAAAVAVAACAGAWARQAADSLVIELGADRRPGRPVAAQLARALADPGLELRYAMPGIGWVDERGRTVPAPDGGAVTRAVVPGGGEVALVHGAVGAGDPRLAEAAAAAAALALDSARLEAAVQNRAADVRASRRRLLTAADAERRALEQRLSDGPLAGLRRVDRLLSGELRDELRAVIAELADLGRGLYPPALARADLAAALTEMAARSPVPATVEIAGDERALTDELRATAWFVCSEALANVARHSHATSAAIGLRIGAELLVEVRDDGRGGAVATRGLRGLADRVEASGGALTIASPPGGPTIIRARLPA